MQCPKCKGALGFSDLKESSVLDLVRSFGAPERRE